MTRITDVSRLAQLVERKTLNLVVVGSSPTVGVPFGLCKSFIFIFYFFRFVKGKIPRPGIEPGSGG